MVNASIASSQGIVVEGQAWVFGGTLCGCDRFAPSHRSSPPPTFLVKEGMLFGSPDLTFFRDTFGEAYPLARNVENLFEKGWPISIDKLTLQIVGTLHVTVPTIRLNNTASLVIDEMGKLFIGAPVSIVNDEKVRACEGRSDELRRSKAAGARSQKPTPPLRLVSLAALISLPLTPCHFLAPRFRFRSTRRTSLCTTTA